MDIAKLNASRSRPFPSSSWLPRPLKGFDGALIVIGHEETFLQTIGIEREIVL